MNKQQSWKEVLNEDNVKFVAELVKNGDSITGAVKTLCEEKNILYTDSLRRVFSRKLSDIGITRKLEPNLEESLSALKEDGSIMTIEEYCDTYGLDVENVKSFKLVTHTGVPYYNIQSKATSVESTQVESKIKAVLDYVDEHKPDYTKLDNLNPLTENLLILDIADLHIGKLGRKYETGEDYDSAIAKQRAWEGIRGIMSKARAFEIDRVLFIIGNDILHTDGAKRTTTSGTLQDTDGMFYDNFNDALKLYVEIIENLALSYNVDIVFNPSNHDYVAGFMLARTVGVWFKDHPNVQIDDSIAHRKYFQYGVNMIATTHGDGAKLQDIPLLMATEDPEMWANTTYRYCYSHHIHHKQVNKFQSAKDLIGVTVEYLRSPSSPDSWHYRNGYCGGKKAIEGFIHNFNEGQIARISHYF